MRLTAVLKKVVINHTNMKKAESRSTRRGTTKALAFIRNEARWKVLLRGKGTSKPGDPPKIHSSGYASLKNIRFEYDAATESGVVGPVLLNQVASFGNPAQTVPNVLQKGGTVQVLEEEVQLSQAAGGGRFWIRVDLRRRRTRNPPRPRRVRRVRILARPYMDVALDNQIKAGTVETAYANTFF